MNGKNSFAPLPPPVLSSGGPATGLRTARRRARIDDVEDELTAAVLVLALSMLQQPEGNDPGPLAAGRSCSALVVRLGHLGHTQVGDRQLEIALLEHLCAYFLGARALSLSNCSLFRSVASTLS